MPDANMNVPGNNDLSL